jgi:hypothetical protein
MVRDGAALVRKLDESDWRVSAAFWFYFPDANAWRLLIASPEVEEKGPREAYTAVQSAMATLAPADRGLSLEDIGVVPSDHPLIKLLRVFITTGRDIARIRFSKNVINGHFIDDALIYRMN